MYNLTKTQKKVYEFLKSYYTNNGISPTMKEVAAEFGKSIPTVQGYFSALEKKGAISRNSHKSRSITVNSEEDESIKEVAVMGIISAGAGIEVIEEEIDAVKVPSNWISDSLIDYYALKVSGFSMYEDGILDGDYVVVRKQSFASDGDIVVGIIHDEFDEKATLKTIKDSKEPVITLKPSNPMLDDIKVNRENFEIRGKFVGMIRN